MTTKTTITLCHLEIKQALLDYIDSSSDLDLSGIEINNLFTIFTNGLNQVVTLPLTVELSFESTEETA